MEQSYTDAELLYKGDVDDKGRPNGNGRLLKMTLVVEPDPNTDQNFKLVPKYNVIYDGNWKNGLKHGEGTEFVDDLVIHAIWKDGKKHGYSFVRAGDSILSAVWKDGKLTKYVFPNLQNKTIDGQELIPQDDFDEEGYNRWGCKGNSFLFQDQNLVDAKKLNIISQTFCDPSYHRSQDENKEFFNAFIKKRPSVYQIQYNTEQWSKLYLNLQHNYQLNISKLYYLENQYKLSDTDIIRVLSNYDKYFKQEFQNQFAQALQAQYPQLKTILQETNILYQQFDNIVEDFKKTTVTIQQLAIFLPEYLRHINGAQLQINNMIGDIVKQKVELDHQLEQLKLQTSKDAIQIGNVGKEIRVIQNEWKILDQVGDLFDFFKQKTTTLKQEIDKKMITKATLEKSIEQYKKIQQDMEVYNLYVTLHHIDIDALPPQNLQKTPDQKPPQTSQRAL